VPLKPSGSAPLAGTSSTTARPSFEEEEDDEEGAGRGLAAGTESPRSLPVVSVETSLMSWKRPLSDPSGSWRRSSGARAGSALGFRAGEPKTPESMAESVKARWRLGGCKIAESSRSWNSRKPFLTMRPPSLATSRRSTWGIIPEEARV
jgi:hypothetical protein